MCRTGKNIWGERTYSILNYTFFHRKHKFNKRMTEIGIFNSSLEYQKMKLSEHFLLL